MGDSDLKELRRIAKAGDYEPMNFGWTFTPMFVVGLIDRLERAEAQANSSFAAGLEAAAEMADEIAVKCDGNPIAITFRAFGGNLRAQAIRSRARDLTGGEKK